MPGKAHSPNENGPVSGAAEEGAVLTANPLVRDVGEKAPPVGLEGEIITLFCDKHLRQIANLFGTLSGTLKAELSDLAQVWPRLPPDTRQQVLAIVLSALSKGTPSGDFQNSLGGDSDITPENAGVMGVLSPATVSATDSR
ncbi:MAG: hypothetical protein SFX18_06905 [Pirellulales bacterium]|nr:hypothetical protein [Pirellulales bacterium]